MVEHSFSHTGKYSVITRTLILNTNYTIKTDSDNIIYFSRPLKWAGAPKYNSGLKYLRRLMGLIFPLRSLSTSMKFSTAAHRVSIWTFCHKTLGAHSLPFLDPSGRFSADQQHLTHEDSFNTVFLVFLMDVSRLAVSPVSSLHDTIVKLTTS